MRALILALSMALAPVTLSSRPTIVRITPSSGPIAGGTSVTLSGTQFTGATVKIGEVVVTPISATDTEIVFVTPKHNNGIATVAVQGTDVAEYTEFLYLPPRLEDLPPGFITRVMGIG